jgi:dipeptidase D
MPHGPISMHPEINNLVFTSTNLSSIQMIKNRMKLKSSQRSFKESSSKEISDKMIELFQLAGIEIRSIQRGGFGAWIPNFNSRLMNISRQVYKELFNNDPFIIAVHAGLEPGIFKPNFPNLDMISIGPNMEFCHSPDERVDIESVNIFWKYLINLIKKLNEIL